MLPLSKSENFRQIKIFILIYLAGESLSWLAFNYEFLSLYILTLIAVLTVFICLWRPRFMLLVPIAELAWGSVGHSFVYGEIPLRYVIFAAVGLAFIIKYFIRLLKLKFWTSELLLILWVLSLALVTAAVWHAKIQGISWGDIFFDSNAYLYLLYLPVWYQVFDKSMSKYIISVIIAAGLVVAIKSILLFNIFVHDYGWLDTDMIYRWVRDLRTGEITPFANDFARVFMPAQIFVVVAAIVAVARQLRDYRSWKNLATLSILFSALYISLSRSFWLGLVAAILTLLIAAAIYHRSLLPGYVIILFVLVSIGAALIVELFYNIPKYKDWNIFYQRTASLEESAANSRMQLLQPMWQTIKDKPILGHGFAKLISYESFDPRIRTDNNPTGLYTTYSFEWGWLDQWVKMGIFYIIVQLAWLLLILWRLYKMLSDNFVLSISMLSSLAGLMAIHVFSPYLNHPLGIGILMLASVISSNHDQQAFSYN